jgi:hypothetical protein
VAQRGARDRDEAAGARASLDRDEPTVVRGYTDPLNRTRWPRAGVESLRRSVTFARTRTCRAVLVTLGRALACTS